MSLFNSGFNFNSILPPHSTGILKGVTTQLEANGLQLPFYRYDYSGEMKVGISGVHDGDRLARLSFYMTGQTNLSGFRFLATIDDIYYGCYRSYQEDEWIPSGFATIQVAGLSNTETRDLYLRPLKVTYDESGKYSSAFRGPKSNTVQISPEPKHPETSGVVRDLQLEKGDLIYTSAKTFNDSNFDYSSQYSYGGNSYDPISFTPNVAVGIFYATAKYQEAGCKNDRRIGYSRRHCTTN